MGEQQAKGPSLEEGMDLLGSGIREICIFIPLYIYMYTHTYTSIQIITYSIVLYIIIPE